MRRKGFTLIELIVVCAIIFIMGSIIYGAVKKHQMGGVQSTPTSVTRKVVAPPIKTVEPPKNMQK